MLDYCLYSACLFDKVHNFEIIQTERFRGDFGDHYPLTIKIKSARSVLSRVINCNKQVTDVKNADRNLYKESLFVPPNLA